MDRYDVRVTDYAVGQMAETTQYISGTLASPEAARRLLADLKSAMAECAYLPSRYALVQSEPWKSEGIRLIAVKNFHLYYRIDEEMKQVWFIAVIYAGRNQDRELLNALLK